MTKAELINEYHALCNIKNMTIDGIYSNCNKSEILNAIKCLECPDDVLNDYLTIIKLKYPNTYKTIINNGDYRKHPYNRLYVYNTARFVLS